MKTNKLFPTTLSGRNEYYNTVFPFLMDAGNRTRFVLDATTELDDANDNFTDVWSVKYPLSVNSATSTKPIRTDRNESDDFLQTMLRKVYGEIPQSVLTSEDRETLNLHLRSTAHASRPALEISPFVKFTSLGDGRVRVIARTTTDGSRASMPENADAVEVVYAFDTIPVNPAACPYHQISSDARFVINNGTEFLGKRMYGFARWINLSDPSKNGPFSDIISTVLGGSLDEG